MGEWDLDSPAKGDSGRKRPAASEEADDHGRPPVAAAPVAAGRSGPGPGTPVPQSPRRRWKGFSYVWLAIAVVALFVGVMAGFFIARSGASEDEAALADANLRLSQLQSALSSSEDRNWTYYRANNALKEELERATSSGSQTVPSSLPEDGVYTDGVYLVGEDIPAGTYDGAVNGDLGYWARLKDTDGSIASIEENAIVKGPFVLTVEPGDKAVELRGVTLTRR